MLRLYDGLTGELAHGGVYFSDLLAAAFLGRTTGHLHLSAPQGEAHVYLRDGALAHVSGSALLHDFLGQLAVEEGITTQVVVDEIFAVQQRDPQTRRLFGELLRRAADVDATGVERLVALQIGRRVLPLFGLCEGHFAVRIVDAPEIEGIAVEVPAPSLFMRGLRESASEQELQEISDQLLGHAVSLHGQTGLVEQLGLTAEEQTLLGYLDRPRKVHHLESVESRALARSMLKALFALDLLALRPASEGLAIPKAVRLPRTGPSSLEPRLSDGGRVESTPVEAPPSGPPPRVSVPAAISALHAATAPPVARGASQASLPVAGGMSAQASAALVKEMKEIMERVGKASFYEIFNVKNDASVQVIRTAYTQLAKKYHPDALGPGASEAATTLAREVASMLNEAYTVLSDSERRGRYNEQARAGNLKGDDAQAGRFSSAKLKFEMANVFLKKRDFKKARETLRFAVDLAPESGLFRGALAWAHLADPGLDRKEALQKADQLLHEAVKQAPREATVHYYLGRLYKERGELGLAEPAFRKAFQLDPKLHEAEAEVRIFDRRKEKDKNAAEDKGGALGKLTRLFKR